MKKVYNCFMASLSAFMFTVCSVNYYSDMEGLPDWVQCTATICIVLFGMLSISCLKEYLNSKP